MKMHASVFLVRATLGECESEHRKTLPTDGCQVLGCFCRQYPELEIELEIGIGVRLFEMSRPISLISP